MNIDTWLIYLTTVLVFMVTPGPSHLLMLSNSMIHGFRPSLATAAGDLTANALQMTAAALGLAALLVASQHALAVVKWAGVAYLVWMGVRMWRHAGSASSTMGATRTTSRKALWLQGFLTSAANPKAVVFFAALFPQFIDPTRPLLPQFLALSLTYIVVDGSFLVSYGAGASWVASRLKGSATVIIHRIGGLALIVAAMLLGLKTLREAP